MKKKTNVKTLIRQIVREEVAMAIKEVITELKKPVQPISKPRKITKAIGKEIKRKKVNYSNNPIINEVMNETANSDDWKSMGDGTYDSSRMNDILSSAYNNPNDPNGNLAASMGVSADAPGMDFLKKDYRGLMKAVNEKAKEKRGM